MQSDKQLMRKHVDALFTHDTSLRIRSVNEPNGINAPRLFLGRTSEGNLWRFHADLPTSVVEQLESFCIDEPATDELQSRPRHQQSYITLLQSHAPVQNVWAGPAYYFPNEPLETSVSIVTITPGNAELLLPDLAGWIDDVPFRRPFLAVIEAGRAVSVCCSVRITSEAHEAGVETVSAFRGRGYAAAVVSAWANAVRILGCVPLYSTSWDNVGSQAVAKRLALVPYGTDFHVS